MLHKLKEKYAAMKEAHKRPPRRPRREPSAPLMPPRDAIVVFDRELLGNVLRAMHENRAETDLLEDGCLSLADLALCAPVFGVSNPGDEVVLAGGAEAVVRAMREHLEAPSLLDAGCVALTNMGHSLDDHRAHVVQVGGAEAVLQAMHEFLLEEGLQERCIRALDMLAEAEDNRALLVDAGAVHAVVIAMREHAGDTGIAEWGCRLLAHLAHRSDVLAIENHLSPIIQGDAAEAVVDAMHDCLDSQKVQQWGCAALCRFAHLNKSAEAHARIAGAGGIEAVVATMRAHPESACVQDWACRALRELAQNLGNQTRIKAAGGVEALITLALTGHGADEAVATSGLEALANIATGSSANLAEIAHHGGIEATSAVVVGHMNSPSLLGLGCRALWRLSQRAENRAIMAKAGAPQLVVETIKAFPESAEVKAYAFRALSALCEESIECQILAIEAGAASAIVGAMQRGSALPNLQENAISALLSLATSSPCVAPREESAVPTEEVASRHKDRVRSVFLEAGGLRAVLRTLQAGVTTPGLQKRGIGALWAVIQSAGPEGPAGAAWDGVVSVLVRILEATTACDVAECALFCLVELSGSGSGCPGKESLAEEMTIMKQACVSAAEAAAARFPALAVVAQPLVATLRGESTEPPQEQEGDTANPPATS